MKVRKSKKDLEELLEYVRFHSNRVFHEWSGCNRNQMTQMEARTTISSLCLNGCW